MTHPSLEFVPSMGGPRFSKNLPPPSMGEGDHVSGGRGPLRGRAVGTPFGACRHHLSPRESVSHDSQVAVAPLRIVFACHPASGGTTKLREAFSFISCSMVSTGCSAPACGGSPAQPARGNLLNAMRRDCLTEFIFDFFFYGKRKSCHETKTTESHTEEKSSQYAEMYDTSGIAYVDILPEKASFSFQKAGCGFSFYC